MENTSAPATSEPAESPAADELAPLAPSVLAEYRAVRQSVGVLRRKDLAVLRFTGRDPLRIAQGLITSDLQRASLGQAVYGAMLTPKGRIVSDLRAWKDSEADGADVWLLVPRVLLATIREHLSKYVPPLFARWSDVSDEHKVIGVYGPLAKSLLESTLETGIPDLGEDQFTTIRFEDDDLVVLATRDAGREDGFDVVGRKSAVDDLHEKLLHTAPHGGSRARAIGEEALEILRIEAGRPRAGSELTEEVIATEAYEASGLLSRAISSTKGCYTGQEVIVRIAHRGHVNRHLRGLLFGPECSAPSGTPLWDPARDREIGRVTSAAFSPLAGEYVGLGYVRRQFGPGDVIRTGSSGGPPVRIRDLPFTA